MGEQALRGSQQRYDLIERVAKALYEKDAERIAGQLAWDDLTGWVHSIDKERVRHCVAILTRWRTLARVAVECVEASPSEEQPQTGRNDETV